MQSELRAYINSQPEELAQLQDLAAQSGMKVFVDVHDDFPSNFIDTIPFLVAICEKFEISTAELRSMCRNFAIADKSILSRLGNFRPSSRPHEVTTSFLLTAIVAHTNRDLLQAKDLEAYGWHREVAEIVLGHNA